MLSAPLSFGGSAEGMISRVNFDGEEELSAEAALLFFNGTVVFFTRSAILLLTTQTTRKREKARLCLNTFVSAFLLV